MQLELFQRNGVKKLENKIHIYELDCYKNATEEQKKRMRVRKDRYFDLEGLPSEEVRKLLEDFVWERGKNLLQVVWHLKYYILIISGIFL